MEVLTPSHGAQRIESDWSDAERRAYERHAAQSYLRAVDTATGVVLGEIEDISLGGFKLQVQQPIRRRETYPLCIEILIDGQARPPIAVTARNVWVHNIAFDGKTHAGFVFIGLSPTARTQIEAFFHELS